MIVKIIPVSLFFLALSIVIPKVKADNPLDVVINSKIMEQDDNFIHGLIFFNGYLWASTRTKPCRILKINPETLNYERIVLDADSYYGEDLLSADGYIWVILNSTPSKIIRIDAETLQWEIALTFQQDELRRGGSLENAFGYLWVGGYNGKIARINFSDLNYQIFDYSSSVGDLQFHALVSGGGYIWGSCPNFKESGSQENGNLTNLIVRINPNNPMDYEYICIENAPMSDDMVYVGEYLFTGSEIPSSSVYKISNDLSYRSTHVSDTMCYGVFTDRKAIWSAYRGSPGKIVRHDLNLHIDMVYELPSDFNNANEIVIDPFRDILYITCWESPAKILKMSLSALHDSSLQNGQYP